MDHSEILEDLKDLKSRGVDNDVIEYSHHSMLCNSIRPRVTHAKISKLSTAQLTKLLIFLESL